MSKVWLAAMRFRSRRNSRPTSLRIDGTEIGECLAFDVAPDQFDGIASSRSSATK